MVRSRYMLGKYFIGVVGDYPGSADVGGEHVASLLIVLLKLNVDLPEKSVEIDVKGR